MRMARLQTCVVSCDAQKCGKNGHSFASRWLAWRAHVTYVSLEPTTALPRHRVKTGTY